MTKQTLKPAPIVLFVYKRLDTLKLTIKALKDNSLAKESDLFIFSDAAKTDQDKPIIDEVRHYSRSISGFKSVQIIEAPKNKGLAKSIIEGVSDIINQYDRVIVLEDDLQTTPNFLHFMNTCLDFYESNKQVFSVSGYSFNLGIQPAEVYDVYLLNRGWSWGWSTWKDRWNEVDWAVTSYDSFTRNPVARREFSKGGSDLNQMLDKQMAGKLDSWAIRWFYHQFHVGGLTVYPILSKVYNNGFDTNATHTHGSNKRYIPVLDNTLKNSFKLPTELYLQPYYQKRFQGKMGYLSRIVSKAQTMLKKLIDSKR